MNGATIIPPKSLLRGKIYVVANIRPLYTDVDSVGVRYLK